MENSKSVRKHRTPARREEILQDYRQSQLTQERFAAQVGISVSTLQAWLRKKPVGDARPAAFVAVPNLLASLPAAPAYRLQWPSGLALEVRAGYCAQELAALLRLLPAL